MPEADVPPAEDREAWPERRLMGPLKAFLEGPFRAGLDLADHGAVVVQDTSAFGAPRGRWARPDLILVSAMRFKLPGSQVDLQRRRLSDRASGVAAPVDKPGPARVDMPGKTVKPKVERSGNSRAMTARKKV